MTAKHLSQLTLDHAIDYFNVGRISQVEYEAYRRAWAQGNPSGHYASGWLTPSWDEQVEQLAAQITAEARRIIAA